MIIVTVSCDNPDCPREQVVTISSDQLYGNIAVKNALPRGWRTFTPKSSEHAVAYCPEHG